MIKLKNLLKEINSNIKWIIGYIDGYGAVHHKVVKVGDPIDNHNIVWNGVRHNKWRWLPSEPNKINTYGEDLGFESEDKVWQIIDRYK